MPLNSYTCNIKVGLFQEKKRKKEKERVGGGLEMSHLDVLYEEHKNVFDIKLFTDKTLQGIALLWDIHWSGTLCSCHNNHTKFIKSKLRC